ncbi:hypothetical protein L1887_21143 [Cichorium endivia]|nr:hypothetical protein L1887_21143 [Cichorium endivia]
MSTGSEKVAVWCWDSSSAGFEDRRTQCTMHRFYKISASLGRIGTRGFKSSTKRCKHDLIRLNKQRIQPTVGLSDK